MKKILATLTIFTSLIFFLAFIPNARAQTYFPPFAGLASFSIPCTCSGTLFVWFTPLYLGGPVALTGPMVYSPFSTILFAYYHIGVPGIWHLGSYIPLAPACWILVPAPPPVFTICIPLPALGTMFLVGTNRFP